MKILCVPNLTAATLRPAPAKPATNRHPARQPSSVVAPPPQARLISLSQSHGAWADDRHAFHRHAFHDGDVRV